MKTALILASIIVLCSCQTKETTIFSTDSDTIRIDSVKTDSIKKINKQAAEANVLNIK